MTSTSTSIRRLAIFAVTGLATLAIAPAALADTGNAVPDRADGLGGANPTTHTLNTIADRDHPYTVDATFQAPPDRVDALGSARVPSVSVPTVIIRSTGSGFDWTAAVIGAVAGIGFALVALAGTLLVRGRRDVALPSDA
jgi:hypothetical protein